MVILYSATKTCKIEYIIGNPSLYSLSLLLSSRMFHLLLLPWLESLPKLLVDLGQSNPPLSAFVIDSLASAAAHIPLQQLEHHLVSIIGMYRYMCTNEAFGSVLICRSVLIYESRLERFHCISVGCTPPIRVLNLSSVFTTANTSE